MIKEKAIKTGVLLKEGFSSDERIAECIFAPGFSTAGAVTEISGRGVGMDAVRLLLEEIRGNIEIKLLGKKEFGFSSFHIVISLPESCFKDLENTDLVA